VLFVWTIKSRTLEHSDRLSLAPLEEDRFDDDPALNRSNSEEV
jgi:hypothetical protein